MITFVKLDFLSCKIPSKNKSRIRPKPILLIVLSNDMDEVDNIDDGENVDDVDKVCNIDNVDDHD